MQYGFIIDNRKCIGCHACTVACKSEHQVPVGVNRTYVQQIEKGRFPDTRRLFSVMRCNHCSNAPCVEICPTQALFVREDGIVDFDHRRCIGCKSCMQACPYDALYIDPESHTAAKCNYCAHRIDIGLEPACVNVCPENAIISGDMDHPESEISRLLKTEKVQVRKPEKHTAPNLFYIAADPISLIPEASEEEGAHLWSSQSKGVGHFAGKEVTNAAPDDLLAEAKANNWRKEGAEILFKGQSPPIEKSIDALLNRGKSRRVYDRPDKGLLWGWEVSAYTWTKSISAGLVLLLFLSWFFNISGVIEAYGRSTIITSLCFLLFTGIFLVKDLDQPRRFSYVLLRPHWKSWLVKGAYALSAFALTELLWLFASYFDILALGILSFWGSTACAVLLAMYTAFLFKQARGRDFWQSSLLPYHMLLQSILGGAAVFNLLAYFLNWDLNVLDFSKQIIWIGIALNLLFFYLELFKQKHSADGKAVVQIIREGHYKHPFRWVCLGLGNLLPLALMLSNQEIAIPVLAIFVLIGLYVSEHIWVSAPQLVKLT